MDIIVVKYSDDKYISSPFNVRFGGLKILKTKEKIVDIFVNDVKSELTMRLNENGDGFFVKDKDHIEENENRKKRLSELFLNQNIIANNVETEIKKSNDINDDKLICKDNIISSVLSFDHNHNGIKLKEYENEKNNNNIFENIDITQNLIDPGFEEQLSIDSDIEEEEIIIESVKTIDKLTLLENKLNIININEYDSKTREIADINLYDKKCKIDSENLNSGEEISDLYLSDCLSALLKNPEKASEIFNQNEISFEIFIMDPWKMITNQNIVFKFKDKIYPIKVGLPIILAKFIFKKKLPEDSIKKLYQSKSYFGIKSNDLEPELKKIKIDREIKLNDIKESSKSLSQDVGLISVNDIGYDTLKKRSIVKKQTLSNKVKSTNPSTDQIKLLNLKRGKNTIKFVCRSRLSGEHILESEIYLWDKYDKIIISDVDGTITKSDVLGQLMPMFGNDWAQPGVTELFNSIEKNGYKIIYLTARAICQSTTTKTYLNTLNQNNIKLPKGPLVMSPDGLFTSFKREVIDKTPQILKIAILTGIKSIFPNDHEPFHAGFGNRHTDAVSYRAVGIKMSNIFIIDEKGEIKQLNNSYKKSYSLLNEIVDQLFPTLE